VPKEEVVVDFDQSFERVNPVEVNSLADSLYQTFKMPVAAPEEFFQNTFESTSPQNIFSHIHPPVVKYDLYTYKDATPLNTYIDIKPHIQSF